jgi:hypothetical protein
MPKKIVSFTLSDESVSKIDKTSKALGMSRSGLMEFLVSKGFQFPNDINTDLDEISRLQKKTKETIEKRTK